MRRVFTDEMRLRMNLKNRWGSDSQHGNWKKLQLSQERSRHYILGKWTRLERGVWTGKQRENTGREVLRWVIEILKVQLKYLSFSAWYWCATRKDLFQCEVGCMCCFTNLIKPEWTGNQNISLLLDTTLLKKRKTSQCKMMYCAAWAAIREQHRRGVLSDRNLFFHTSGGLKSKIKVLAGLVSSKASLTGLQMAAFCFPSVSPHGLSSAQARTKRSHQCLFIFL